MGGFIVARPGLPVHRVKHLLVFGIDDDGD